MFSRATLAFALLASPAAFADLTQDVDLIRSVLPAGQDLAQVQATYLRDYNPSEALKAGQKNYVIKDINGDGKTDILVVAEVNPILVDLETDKPCASTSEPNCHILWGKRSVNLYLGQRYGDFKLAFANSDIALTGEDGGIYGDPLEGFQVQPNGAVRLGFYGGSAWRWSTTYVMQYRKTDFFMIGLDTYSGWNGDLRADTKSINFITGQVVETSQENGDAPVKTRRYNIPVRPLVPVSKFKLENV